MNTDLLQGFYMGDLLIDPRNGQVIGRSGSAHLPPKAMEVLLCLASEPGKLVTRDALIRTVWGEGHGSHEALSHAVSEIRHALDDHREQPLYVQTLPKRGYRLLVGVEPSGGQSSTVILGGQAGATMHEIGLLENLKQRGVLETGIAYLILGWLLIQVADIVFDQLLLPAWAGTFVTALVIAGFPIAVLLSWFLEFRDGRAIPHELTPRESLQRRFSRTYLAVVGGLGIAGVVVFIYDHSIGLPQAEITSSADIAAAVELPPILENSIAVLPFLNVDGSEQTEIFANGLVDDVITSLARVPGLLVSSRGDAFTLDPNTSSSRVRERLRVALYLEGSVQIEGDTMRVILQLIDTETGFHVLSRSIDRPVESFLEMRNEITALTVANVRVALPAETQLLPVFDSEVSDLNAYVLYRRGKEIYEQPRTVDSLAEVIGYYEEALALDPGYAAAHAGLCATYVARFGLSNSTTDIDDAEHACALALNSNPHLHMVYSALGDLYRRTARNAEAESAYGKALEINPQDAQAMSGMARVYRREQRYDEAEELFRKAIEIQPGSWRAIDRYGTFLFTTGRYDEAAVAYRQVAQLDPVNRQAWTHLGSALTMAGDFESGRLAYEESLRIEKSETAHSNLGVIYYYLGEFEKSVAEHRAAVSLNPGQTVKWLNLADALYFAGETVEATSAFGKASELAESRLSVDPDDFDTLFLLGWAQQMLGDAAAARESIDKGMGIAPNDPYGLYYGALIEVRAGNHDAALRALQSALDNGYPAKMLAVEPYLEELQQDPKFRRIISASNE
jgi:tetratricopeptide (TPR) repeat protein/DNA-binding winged helix-turn-helix (wHTH) protein